MRASNRDPNTKALKGGGSLIVGLHYMIASLFRVYGT